MEISVIIPTFKPGDYLFDCLKSLEMQTIDNRLFEVIIVLNGPREPYFNIISDFISNIEFNVSLYYSEIAGVSNARNVALDNTISNYIAFIDDDDIVSPTYLDGLLNLACSDSIVISNSKTFINDIRQTGKDYISYAYEACKYRKKVTILNGRRFFSNGCGKLIPMSVIGKIRFDHKLVLGEDSVFMVEISKNIKNLLIASDDVIYYIRLRDNSASRKRREFKEILNSKYSEFKKYISFYLRFPPIYNLLFVAIIMLASLKSFIAYLYKNIHDY
jgi:glycosyltransferase involved in cell wall biosynthesis